jgi:hypothetical protein
MDDETNWQRQLLVGLTVLVAVGALIGGIVALISIKAADYAGIDGDQATTSPSTGRWSEPSEDEPPSDDEPSEPATTEEAPSTPTPSTATKKPQDKGITLVATPTTVSTYGRINLSGTYTGGAGTTLQVQRMEGGQWVDFPTSATVNGRTFATYVETGRPGPNKFRVKAIGESKTSNPVTVRVT